MIQRQEPCYRGDIILEGYNMNRLVSVCVNHAIKRLRSSRELPSPYPVGSDLQTLYWKGVVAAMGVFADQDKAAKQESSEKAAEEAIVEQCRKWVPPTHASPARVLVKEKR